MSDREYRFATRAIHAGQKPDAESGAIMTPIYQTSTYVQDAVGQPRGGYEYARVTNPTRTALEENVAALEGGRHGMAFASGLAAIEALVKRLSAGDHVVYEENVYGGTHRMFQMVLGKLGVEFTPVDTRDPENVRRALRHRTKLIHLETPTNPMMRITDLRAVAAIGHELGIPVVVDNTFASPYLQQPIRLGAHFVVHSLTKYLGGHSDLVGGAVVTTDDEAYNRLKFLQNAVGAVPGPMDAFLVLRGIKTLPLRMDRKRERVQVWVNGWIGTA